MLDVHEDILVANNVMIVGNLVLVKQKKWALQINETKM